MQFFVSLSDCIYKADHCVWLKHIAAYIVVIVASGAVCESLVLLQNIEGLNLYFRRIFLQELLSQ